MIKVLHKPAGIPVSVLGRGAAEGTRTLTGSWPGEGGRQPGKEA